MSSNGELSATQPPSIGRYRILKILGRGGMGVVYLGYDEAIDRQVAIKTIHRQLLDHEGELEWLERFRREVRAAGRCLHPNIVTVFEYGEADGAPYIVMEYVQGRELRDYLKERQPLPLDSAVAIILQVLNALSHAHAQGVVHRDIKPANIIVLADGQVKVTDFGIARMDASSDLTQVGMMVGSPSYMAPEQFSDQHPDHRADVYAAGVVLFELLTGVRPFSGRNASELMYQVLTETHQRPTQINPALPTELDAVLNRALAKAPGQRFQDAGAFITALEGLKLVEREAAMDGSTVIRIAPVQTPEPPVNAVPGWDATLLAQAEQFLVETLGPVAKVLVRRTALQVGSPAELIQQLAAAIPHEPDRTRFLRRMRVAMGGTVTATGLGSSALGSLLSHSQMSRAMGPFEQAALETVREELTLYLGPIAKVLVKQTAARARNLNELYQQLAEQIPATADRAAFLKRAPGQDSGSSA
ncbi:MAG: serine/threonine protein kinase [Candidatus Contendobacter sp.]|jgi:tRNA A-37 threonylcarbamoyl transferase component Bud32|nr:serine/threonine protein kinase [Gammaproteobacteria bacterium]MCC8994624.1 serine/threonine protein kinase [Candidatus Contendobacter sp.]